MLLPAPLETCDLVAGAIQKEMREKHGLGMEAEVGESFSEGAELELVVSRTRFNDGNIVMGAKFTVKVRRMEIGAYVLEVLLVMSFMGGWNSGVLDSAIRRALEVHRDWEVGTKAETGYSWSFPLNDNKGVLDVIAWQTAEFSTEVTKLDFGTESGSIGTDAIATITGRASVLIMELTEMGRELDSLR